jgi:two-component system OmpR family response regulator
MESYAAPCSSSVVAPTAPKTQTALDRPIQVLLVEDNPEAAWLAQANLADPAGQQFQVEWVQTLYQGMKRLVVPGIEVILLDLGLPELDGYRSFRAIQSATNRKVPVVILTADDRFLSKDLTMGFGASDYLIKDRVSPFQLRESLRRASLRGRPQLH